MLLQGFALSRFILSHMILLPFIPHLLNGADHAQGLCCRFFDIRDGSGAGPDQRLEGPLGQRRPELFSWFFAARHLCNMVGKGGGESGVDNDFASMGNFGAFIVGCNMFGPVRGPWLNEQWNGWWGVDPPYHAPTFILTRHARASIVLQGGTAFDFVTDGIDSAVRQARAAAGEHDVKIGGGVSTVRQLRHSI